MACVPSVCSFCSELGGYCPLLCRPLAGLCRLLLEFGSGGTRDSRLFTHLLSALSTLLEVALRLLGHPC
jgi:hypothetical protein